MAEHEFRLTADWNGGRNADGRISAGNLETQISIPQEMGGPGVGTNPDEMLIGAAATCYIITLAAMLERRRIPVKKLSLESIGVVSENKGRLRFESITHKPRLTLGAAVTEEQLEEARALTETAEQTCMISNALRGNVALSVAAQVDMEE
ncbi:peroxiredoxin-like protein [Kroppenstedtia sanguinis]|uniref:SACOL1771 family peroxiredoxin n=1 Tax=Kroppenstedtia sanguinis TaxID=1380684 RepID=A0ABW4C582_9BACL